MEKTVLIGHVVHGKGLGKRLGAPTVNFDAKPQILEHGVYVGVLRIVGDDDQKKYSSVANWGTRPTFGENEPILEVHVLDFADELYGKEVSFEFLKKLREVRAFESPEALQLQIQNDIAEARAFFA